MYLLPPPTTREVPLPSSPPPSRPGTFCLRPPIPPGPLSGYSSRPPPILLWPEKLTTAKTSPNLARQAASICFSCVAPGSRRLFPVLIRLYPRDLQLVAFFFPPSRVLSLPPPHWPTRPTSVHLPGRLAANPHQTVYPKRRSLDVDLGPRPSDRPHARPSYFCFPEHTSNRSRPDLPRRPARD